MNSAKWGLVIVSIVLAMGCDQSPGWSGNDTADGDTSSTGDGDTSTGTGDGDTGSIDRPAAPELRTPIQGEYIGSAHAPQSLRPRFTWTSVDLPVGASSLKYEIEASTDPTFAGAKGATVSGTAWQPVDELTVSITAPVGDRYYWRVRACADVSVCSEWSNERWIYLGRPIKDVNGDGFPDVLASEPWVINSGSYGLVKIHKGGQGPGFDTTADWTLDGDVEGYKYGQDVVAADVNGDGYSDVVVGSQGLNDRGRLQVHLSSDSGPSDLSYVEFLDFSVTYSNYAWHLGNAGDVNGDGYADIVVGEPGSNSIDGNFPGNVHVYLGAPSFTSSVTRLELQGVADRNRFGSSVAGCDVNGDGYSDVVVGAPARSGGGAAYIYTGSGSGISTTAWATLTATGASAFGADVACAGDVNGDGYGDVIVGDEQALSAHLYFGAADSISGTPDHTVTGPASSLFGRAVGTGGDMDRDGYSDFIVTAPGHTVYGSGALLVWRGGPGSLQTQADGQINHYRTSSGEVGNALGLARDLNGDGYVDIPAGKGYSYSGAYVFIGEGNLSYDDDPPELTGPNDYGASVF